MADSLPPPIYSQRDPDEHNPISPSETDVLPSGPQVLIIPTGDAVNFQKGFLGAEGERAAIEGELQIKGTEPDKWAKVTMLLRTVEAAYDLEIELGSSEIVLFSRPDAESAIFPSSFSFAIPLTSDTPQSIQASHSSLSHYLTVTLHPFDHLLPSLSKTLTVHTRRYTSHSHTIPVAPEVHTLEEPTRVEVEVPRTTFKAGEPVPVYVTVPPPSRELVVDQGLRLRNVRVELVRVVKVKRNVDDEGGTDYDTDMTFGRKEGSDEQTTVHDGPSSALLDDLSEPSSSKAPLSPISLGSSHRTVIARSGASCRFHTSRPVKLRFVLHQAIPSGSPADFPVDLPDGEYGQYENDAECPSITQVTLLHSITFRLVIYISFVDMTTRRERVSVVSIPVIILAPPAPLPQVSHEIDVAYQKKHDQPPLKTVRHDELDYSIPRYSEGEAGPSILPNSAPPPFEERDAPPPFCSDEAQASSSTRLPTFLESESEIIIPDQDAHPLVHPPSSPLITGEGLEFGFPSSEQFDGHTEPMQRSSTPPPTLEMATRDTDLTALTDIREPQLAMEALGLALDRHEEAVAGERPPPPPPAMDDPSDPPPSIDSDFRSPDLPRQATSPHTSPTLHPAYTSVEPPLLPPSPPPVSREPAAIDGFAPPPYLIPGNHNDQESVARPPPYVD
ncbi:hypothetical protein Hypma_015366 [Hypsizygus marmoreus]|uniref:Uncharacterized protein n=1 Tax=Hypsizygus marmoreus TaxID=39966 RepID=A0A369KDI5_HYPMA|nr:hypothetical protein Hypma_015366 [Hypsizygus marmoreus]